MLVSNAIQTAKERREKLLEEVALIDRYLELHQRIFGEMVADNGRLSDVADPEIVPAAARERAKPLNDPLEIVNQLDAILVQATEPMTRGQLRRALESRGVKINSTDVGKYLGTLLWRHQNRFVNVEGRGYWNKDRELPGKQNEIDKLFQ